MCENLPVVMQESIRHSEQRARGRRLASQANGPSRAAGLSKIFTIAAKAAEFGEQCADNAESRKTLMHQIDSLAYWPLLI